MFFTLFYGFFKDTATTESNTYLPTLSLHDALPIWLSGRRAGRALSRAGGKGAPRRGRADERPQGPGRGGRPLLFQAAGLQGRVRGGAALQRWRVPPPDRKSTRLNSSH